MGNVILGLLFGFAVLLTLLGGWAKHGNTVFALLSPVFAILGFLTGLLLGLSLEILLLPLLLLTAVSLLPLLRKEDGDEL